MALRTIQAPGIQVNEIDRSQYDNVTDYSMPDSPYCYIAGFADKGDDYAIHAFTRREDFIARYGYPQNEAERYFYNGCLEVIDNGGKLLASKLPYDNNSKDKYAYVDYKIDPNLYPIALGNEIFGNYKTVNDIRETLLKIINQNDIIDALGYDLHDEELKTLPQMRAIVLDIIQSTKFQSILEKYQADDIEIQNVLVDKFYTLYTQGVPGNASLPAIVSTPKLQKQFNNVCHELTTADKSLKFGMNSGEDDYITADSIVEFTVSLQYYYLHCDSKTSAGNDVSDLCKWFFIYLQQDKVYGQPFFSTLYQMNTATTVQTVYQLRDAIQRIVNLLNDQYPYTDLILNDSNVTSYCRIVPDVDRKTGLAKSGMISMEKLDDYLTENYTDIHNKIRIVDITRKQYEATPFESVQSNLSDESDGSKYAIYTNDCLGIVPVIVTPANALYFQSMIQGADSTDYNCIANFNPVMPSNPDVTVMLNKNTLLSNLYIELKNSSDDPPTKETLSKMAADCFPQIEYENNLHYDTEHFKKIGVVVLSAFIDKSNNSKLNFSVLESFTGSLDKTARSLTDNSSIFIDKIVNDNSQYIRLFSDANTKTVQQASIIALKDQTATSLGFYKLDCTKNINTQESILTPLKKRILCNMEDTRGWQVDIIVDAGLTNIAQYLQGVNASYSSELNLAARPSYWWATAQIFDQFCKFTRKDCIYLLDSPRPFCLEGSQKIVRRTKPTNTILGNIVPKLKYLTGINSSYSAGYCDWFKCKDQYNGDTFWCPPSIKAASAYIYTDVYYYPWNAPAGMNRGKLSNVLDTAFSPTNEEAGRLYTQCWNYAVNYPLDGIVIEGQRTFQRKATALDRVNVRRLMIWLEKKVVNVAKYYLYEGHTAYLREKFVNALTPIFEKAVNGYGISDYVIKCDEENNTSTTIDRNELHCSIAVKPIKAVEFIVLNFIVTNQTAEVTEEVKSTQAEQFEKQIAERNSRKKRERRAQHMSTFTNYQVPYKKLGDFNILNDEVYTRQVNATNEDTNFTEAAHLTSIPVADTATVGGVQISQTAVNDDGIYSYDGKLYGLMVDSLSAAYVHVPWKNTTYQVEDNCCLSLRTASEETKDAGAVYVLDISAIPASKLYNIGDMVNIVGADGEPNPYAYFSNVSDDISKPLQDNIDALDTKTTEALAEHNSENQARFTSIDTSVDLLSTWLHENYYLCTETSNDVEIADALAALSSDFEKYLANTLHEGIQTNPAYLKSQADDISAALSVAVSTDYYKKTDVYSKSETYMKTEVSSKEELDAMFKTKQDCLDVHDSINSTQEYDSKDVATVSAIIAFVNSSINRGTATFQGHFSSVDAIPTDGSSASYKHPVPDKNDYIYVDVAESRTWPSQNGSDVIELSAGTWKFLMNSDKWDTEAGIWNWTPEYRITDTIFTDAQTKALNSGITEALVSQYSRDCANLSALSNDFYTLRGPNFRGVLGNLASVDYIPDNLTGTGTAGQVAVFKDSNALTGMDFSPTRELWTFELQDEGQYVKKYILAQTVETSINSSN